MKYKLLLIIPSIFLLVSCMQNKATRTDYETSVTIFDDQKTEIEGALNIFNKQNWIFNIQRADQRKLSSYTLPSENNLSYFISSINGVGQRFEIPNKYQDNEEDFWREKNDNIISVSGMQLDSFLDSLHVSKNAFDILRKFLSKTKFYSLSKITGRPYIEIKIDIADGFIYNPSINEKPIYTSALEIKQIAPNWFYFREYK